MVVALVGAFFGQVGSVGGWVASGGGGRGSRRWHPLGVRLPVRLGPSGRVGWGRWGVGVWVAHSVDSGNG